MNFRAAIIILDVDVGQETFPNRAEFCELQTALCQVQVAFETIGTKMETRNYVPSVTVPHVSKAKGPCHTQVQLELEDVRPWARQCRTADVDANLH